MQVCAGTPDTLPLPPGFAEIEAGTEAQFSDPECLCILPALRQTVACQEDMTALPPPIAATIKVIAKLPRVGHIALMPIKAIVGRRGSFFAHGHSR